MDLIFFGSFNNSPVPSILYELKDPNDYKSFVLFEANDAAVESLKFEFRHQKGNQVTNIFPGDTINEVLLKAFECLKSQKRTDIEELVYGDSNISTQIFQVTFTPASPSVVLVSYTNMTELKQLEEATKKFLRTNPLISHAVDNENVVSLLERVTDKNAQNGLKIIAFSLAVGLLFLILISVLVLFLF